MRRNGLHWEKIGPQDWKYEADDYMLRAEKMDKGHWWFQCYYKNEELECETYAPDKRTAKERAELSMLRHFVERIGEGLRK